MRELDLDRYFELGDEQYGLVFALGILYHLKNPLLFLDTVSHAYNQRRRSGVARPHRGAFPDRAEREVLRLYSRCRSFGCTVFQIGSCEGQRLLHVFRLQFRVVPEEVFTIRVRSDRFNDTPDR